MVISNSFWVWFEDCVFHFLPDFDSTGARAPAESYGQRPSVILVGNHTTPFVGVDTTYLIRFDRCDFSGGGVQYQQLSKADQWPGQFDFNWCTLENSATPLLDLQGSGVDTDVAAGLHTIIISDFAFADNLDPNYIKNHTIKKYPAWSGGAWTPVVSINCSMPRGGSNNCALNGLVMTGIDTSEAHAPAVRIYDGQVGPATITSNTMMGGTDVVDADSKPAGGFVTRSVGGYTIAASAARCPTGASCPPDEGDNVSPQPLSGRSNFALLVGETSGAMVGNASWGLDHSGGVHHWGPKTEHTVLRGRTKGWAPWDPPPLAPGAMAKVSVAVPGAERGDSCIASLTTMAGLGQLTCHVAAPPGWVEVVLMAGEPLDVVAGEARAVVTQFAWL